MKKSRTKKIPIIARKAEKALRAAVRKAIEDHARTGDPVVIWRNGKVAKVDANRLMKK